MTKSNRGSHSRENNQPGTSRADDTKQQLESCIFHLGDKSRAEFKELVTTNNSTGGIVCWEFNALGKVNDMALTPGGKKLKDASNEGGSSENSEVMSYEILGRCFGAQLLKTEREIKYKTFMKNGRENTGPKTDYLCEMFGIHLGVSVTRAMKYEGDFDDNDAKTLLEKKLKKIIESTKNCIEIEKWTRQILHVWTPSNHETNTVIRIYKKLSKKVQSNTVVVVTEASQSTDIFQSENINK